MQRCGHRFAPMQPRGECSVSGRMAQGQHPYHQRSHLTIRIPRTNPRKVWGATPENLLSRGCWRSSEHTWRNVITHGLQRARQVMWWEPRARTDENVFLGEIISQATLSRWVLLGERSIQKPPLKTRANFDHDCHLSPSK